MLRTATKIVLVLALGATPVLIAPRSAQAQTSAEQRAYQAGFQNGVNDRNQNKPLNLRTDNWHGENLSVYQRGYEDGYRHRGHGNYGYDNHGYDNRSYNNGYGYGHDGDHDRDDEDFRDQKRLVRRRRRDGWMAGGQSDVDDAAEFGLRAVAHQVDPIEDDLAFLLLVLGLGGQVVAVG